MQHPNMMQTTSRTLKHIALMIIGNNELLLLRRVTGRVLFPRFVVLVAIVDCSSFLRVVIDWFDVSVADCPCFVVLVDEENCVGAFVDLINVNVAI